jgi:hypothetical protein
VDVMMGSDLVARERIAQLTREADAERLARPLVEARRRARRERFRARVGAIQLAFAKRRRRDAETIAEPIAGA